MARIRYWKARQFAPAPLLLLTSPAFRSCRALFSEATVSMRKEVGCPFDAQWSGSDSAKRSPISLNWKNQRRANALKQNWWQRFREFTQNCARNFSSQLTICPTRHESE